MIGRNDPCWCGSKKKWKHCHFSNEGKDKSEKSGQKYFNQYKIVLKNPEQIEGIKRACKLTANILDKTCKMAQVGITTNELNDYAMKLHQEAGAIAAPLGYGEPPFPKGICTSLNEVICHGIPDDVPLREGDILNIDVSCILGGYFGDCSKMVVLGAVTPLKRLVVDVSQECLNRAIKVLKPDLLLCQIGDVIEDYATS